MRIRPAHAAGTAPPRFVVGKERHRSKWAMRGPPGFRTLRSALRAGPPGTPHPPVRRPPAPLARALPASLGRMPRTKSRDNSRERECAVAGSRPVTMLAMDACAHLDLVLASLCGSTRDPYKVFFPGVHARNCRGPLVARQFLEIAH
jgi:hypothetical protein